MRPADEIRSLLEEQALCWNQGELDRYLSYYAEDAVYVLGDGELLHGAATIARSLKARYGFASGPPGRLTYGGLFSHAIAPDFAIAAGRYRVEAAESESGSPPRRGWFSLVLRRRDRKWQIVLDHPA